MSDQTDTTDNDMKPEYDFSRGVRGKYAARYAQGTNVVLIDPDLFHSFPDAQSVNDALRRYREIRDLVQD